MRYAEQEPAPTNDKYRWLSLNVTYSRCPHLTSTFGAFVLEDQLARAASIVQAALD